MGSFLSGIFAGSNPTLGKVINQSGQNAGTEQGVGQGDVTAASQFYQDILSGDPTKIAQANAPEIAAAQQGEQQAKDTAAQFAPRSGGTAAATSSMDAATRGNIINLIGGEQNQAASGAASLGTDQERLANQSLSLEDQASQQKLQDEQNSIFGQLLNQVGGALGTAATGGLGKIPGLSSVI